MTRLFNVGSKEKGQQRCILYWCVVPLIAFLGICIGSCSQKSGDANPAYKNPDLSVEELYYNNKPTGRGDNCTTAGDEVVQLYLRDVLASVARPIKELKGFQRIALAPGQSKEVSFEIGPNELAMLDKDLNRIVEASDFRIMIGASSKDIRLREIISVQVVAQS